MSKVRVQYYPGWVKSKDNQDYTEAFKKILDFYLFSTPCEYTSSAGKSLKKRCWSKDVWRKQFLRKYLLEVADLENEVSFAKAKDAENINRAYALIKINNNTFHNNRKNLVAFKSSDRPDIIDILFYIRCSLAYGRFQKYTLPDNRIIYVFESVKKDKEGYYSTARLILKEETLLLWASIIMNGPEAMENKFNEECDLIRDKIVSFVERYNPKNRAEILEHINGKATNIKKQINRLKEDNIIQYNNSKKYWEKVGDKC